MLEHEVNKVAMRRFLELVFNRHDTSPIDELIGDDYVDHSAPPDAGRGPQVAHDGFAMYHAAFPDLAVEVGDMLAEGDTVAFRAVWTGTHRGPLMGIPPTGQKVTIRGMVMARFAGGKLVERWEEADMFGLMQQLNAAAN